MTGLVTYDGIPCECSHCGAKVAAGKADMTIMWRNQHGAAIRVFCNQCGIWTDWSMTGKGLQSRIFYPVIPTPKYQAIVEERNRQAVQV